MNNDEGLQELISSAIWTEIQSRAKEFAYGKMTVAEAEEVVGGAAVRVVQALRDGGML